MSRICLVPRAGRGYGCGVEDIPEVSWGWAAGEQKRCRVVALEASVYVLLGVINRAGMELSSL